MNALVLVAALASPTALAGDSSSATVSFDAFSKFFRGNQASEQYPSGAYVSLKFTIDIDSEVKVRTTGTSELEWPEGPLEHSFSDPRATGQLLLKTAAQVKVDVAVDAWGYAFNYNLWVRDYVWTKNQPFEGLLLPGAQTEWAEATIEESLPGVLTYDYYDVLGYPVDIYLTGDLYPTSKARVTGTHIRTDSKTLEHIDNVVELPSPNPNSGELPANSTWFGNIAADFSTDIVATIEVCETYLGLFCYPYTINEVWTLPTDERTFKSDPVDYALDIPAFEPPATTLDLGQVTVGDSVEHVVPVGALSGATVRGTAAAAGSGFSLASGTSWSAESGLPGQVKVVFSPDSVGDFTGSVTLTTNDPQRPTVQVNLTGEGVEEEVEPVDTGDGPSETDDTGNPFERKRCNCASSEPAGALALLPLLGFALRRRR